MHNLTKIKIFRLLLFFTYPFAVLFVYPFARLKKTKKTRYFFFFDRYVIGGAQKIHIDILNSIADTQKEVYFTRYSANDKLKDNFYSLPNTRCKDIHFWCDNLLFRLFSVHFYAFYINRHQDAMLFSSNSTFFYDMLFFISKKIVRTELLHNFTYGNNGMEFFGLANYRYLDHRIVYDSFTLANIRKQYEAYRVPAGQLDKLLFIEPGVSIPGRKPEKPRGLPVKILYAGRGGVQKRIPLLDEIARQSILDGLHVEFHFAGTMMDELSAYVKEHSVLHGEISTEAEMYLLYTQCHIILMTSAYEGFPMLIKEGMANGCVPVVTALEGNKMHLENLQNALLIEHPEDEKQVIIAGLQHLRWITDHCDQLQLLSENCYIYARAHFDKTVLSAKYRNFFLEHGGRDRLI